MTEPLERRLRAALAGGEIPPAEPVRAAARRAVDRRQRRMALLVAVVAVLAVAAGAASVVRSGDREVSVATSGVPATQGLSPPTAWTPPSVLLSTTELSNARWSTLAAAPLAPRVGFASAWTGTELLVWGGATGGGNSPLGDGAAFDPAKGTWRKLAPGPLGPEAAPQAVWTGNELLIFGNGQAAYDPAADRWRPLPAPPASRGRLLAAVWTGTDAVLFRDDRTAASYALARSAWTRLPDLPVAKGTITAIDPVEAGGTLLAWARWEWTEHVAPNTITGDAGIDLLAFDPTAPAWENRSRPGQPAGIQAPPVWIGDAVFIGAAPAYRGASAGPTPGQPGVLYHPRSDSYTKVPPGPLDDLAANATWTGDVVIETSAGRDATAWVPGTDIWLQFRATPAAVDDRSRIFWTGSMLLAYGPEGAFRLGPL